MIDIIISDKIKALCPDLVVAGISCDVVNSKSSEELWKEIDSFAAYFKANNKLEDINKRPAIAATRKAYKKTGKDPNRYRPSAEALCRRICRDMELYRIDTLVDIINLISIKTGYSIGGFDADKIQGNTVTLGIGTTEDVFEGIGRGILNIEGLPVYRDTIGGIGTPTSDNERTKLDLQSTKLLMIINAYSGADGLQEGIDFSVECLQRYAHATNFEISITPNNNIQKEEQVFVTKTATNEEKKDDGEELLRRGMNPDNNENTKNIGINDYVRSYLSDIKHIIPLTTTGGSSRKYYRIIREDKSSVMAVSSDNVAENKAFLHYTKVFEEAGINVPHIISIHPSYKMYILEDLGDTILFDLITKRTEENLSKDMMQLCKKALSQLVEVQFKAAEKIDYHYAYPVEYFDRTAIMWDLNYFKYCLLKPAEIYFSEPKLEKEFDTIINVVMSKPELQTFIYRDFQSRNIMVNNDKLYFIDYQGGRKGVCLYDLASFISQAKARFSKDDKKELSDYYYELINRYIEISKDDYYHILRYTLLLRILQTLGAYGFRGIIEHKRHFIDSLSLGIENFRAILTDIHDSYLTELSSVCKKLESKYCSLPKTQTEAPTKLTINILSFSYKYNEIPRDEINGGGFVFDCRGLPNPHRIQELRPFSGISEPVRKYLDSKPVVDEFINDVIKVLDISVNNYIERGFTNLMVSFGCTGGKHRSAYCAERIAKYYRNNPYVIVVVTHLNKEIW